jgi:hypothetical protein
MRSLKKVSTEVVRWPGSPVKVFQNNREWEDGKGERRKAIKYKIQKGLKLD